MDALVRKIREPPDSGVEMNPIIPKSSAYAPKWKQFQFPRHWLFWALFLHMNVALFVGYWSLRHHISAVTEVVKYEFLDSRQITSVTEGPTIKTPLPVEGRGEVLKKTKK
jgi:hypothetical protein